MMTERQKTGWLYLALVLAVAAFIAFCVPRSQAQIVPIDASKIYVDGSTTSYANYLDTVTGELTIYSTASPAGTTLADLDPTAALAAFTGSANIVTLGTIATGVWSGTALVADKVPAHDALTGFVADEHIDWTAGPLDVGIVLNRETDAFSGVTFNDFAAPFATIGLSADANDDLEIKALLGSDIFILNSDSDGITITDTGTDPTITFDLGVAAEGIVFGGDTFGPTITCAGAGPQIILSDAAGASGFIVADSTTPTPVAQFDVDSNGRTGISGPHNNDAGIYFNSLGTITKGIDLSASGLSGATDYLVYFGATDYWSASGVVMVSDVSFAAAFGKTGDTNTRVTFPAADALGLSCGAVEIARAVEDDVQDEFVVNEGSLDIDFRVESDTIDPAFKVDGATGATTVGGTLTVTGSLLPLGAITGDGGAALSGMLDVVTNDADGKTLTIAESSTVQTNAGAGGEAVWVLPEASTAIGCEYTFVVMAAQALRVDPSDGTDQIILVTGTAGDYYWANAIGETLTIKAVAADAWVVMHSTGTWTEE